MAFSHGSLAGVYLDGYVASPYLKEVSYSGEIDVAETTALGSVSKTYVPGMEDASASMAGMWDRDESDDTLSFSYKVDSLHRTITQATILPRGDSHGELCYMLQGFLTTNGISASSDDVASIELEWQDSTGLNIAKTLHALESRTASDEGTVLDNAVLTSDGGAALLHVTGVSGTTPTLDVKIQHSADDSTYADLISFAQRTAKGSEYVTFSGTVNRYLKVVYTIGGTSPDFTFHVAVGRSS